MEEKRNYHEPCSCNNSQLSPIPAPQKPCGVCRGSDGSCSCLPPKVVPVQTDGCPILFRRVEIPASVGDETTNPPVAGKYRNILLVYEATGSAFLYSSDGIPTQLPQKGEKGEKGEPGTAGPAGPAGPQGPQGEAGPQGIQGEQGPQGIQGETGLAGASATIEVGTTTTLPSGYSASVTNSGTSSAAIFDFAIPQGPKGDKGDTGEKGDTGPQGPAGQDGAIGPQGPQGEQGIQGEPGPQGIQGIQGPQGEQGEQGPAGTNGADGFSPTATVVRTENGATITITDAEGTTTAEVYDGNVASIPIASADVLGAIKVGSNLSITADGTLSADAQQVTLYSSTGQNTDGAMTQKAATDMVFVPANDPTTNPSGARILIGTLNSTIPQEDPTFDGQVAIGVGVWPGQNAITIGKNATGYAPGSITLGYYAQSSGYNAVTLGWSSNSNKARTVSVGAYAQATAEDALALGYEAVASGSGAVALGDGSIASNAYEVSVGSGDSSHSDTYQYRKIVNVADAVNDHDAVTKGQLDTAMAGIPATNNINSADWSALWQ